MIGFGKINFATGARDMVLGFTGWDRPGVMGAQGFAMRLSRYGTRPRPYRARPAQGWAQSRRRDHPRLLASSPPRQRAVSRRASPSATRSSTTPGERPIVTSVHLAPTGDLVVVDLWTAASDAPSVTIAPELGIEGNDMTAQTLDPNLGVTAPECAPQSAVNLDPMRYYLVLVLGLVHALNIADRYVVSTVLEPIRLEFRLSDSGVAWLTGVSLAFFYITVGIPFRSSPTAATAATSLPPLWRPGRR